MFGVPARNESFRIIYEFLGLQGALVQEVHIRSHSRAGTQGQAAPTRGGEKAKQNSSRFASGGKLIDAESVRGLYDPAIDNDDLDELFIEDDDSAKIENLALEARSSASPTEMMRREVS